MTAQHVTSPAPPPPHTPHSPPVSTSHQQRPCVWPPYPANIQPSSATHGPSHSPHSPLRPATTPRPLHCPISQIPPSTPLHPPYLCQTSRLRMPCVSPPRPASTQPSNATHASSILPHSPLFPAFNSSPPPCPTCVEPAIHKGPACRLSILPVSSHHTRPSGQQQALLAIRQAGVCDGVNHYNLGARCGQTHRATHIGRRPAAAAVDSSSSSST
jgi:hypothetical protein